VIAKDSLFVSMAARPLIFLDTLDIDDNHLKDCLSWIEGEHNAYSGYDKLLDHVPPAGIIPLPAIRMDEKSWKMFANEEEPKYVQAKFTLPSVRALCQAKPEAFKQSGEPRVDLDRYGARLNTLLMLPPLALPPAVPNAAEEQELSSAAPLADADPAPRARE